jgi:hypothetical protein
MESGEPEKPERVPFLISSFTIFYFSVFPVLCVFRVFPRLPGSSRVFAPDSVRGARRRGFPPGC